MSWIDQRSIDEVSTLAPDIQNRALWLLYIANWYGIGLYISEGRRSFADQQRYVARGRSLTLRSRHLTGRAFDVDIRGKAPDQVPLAVWTWVGRVGEYLGLRWGGRWRNLRDYRHFEA